MSDEFGRWLGREIEERLLTRRAFCELAGINRSVLFDWLAGRYRPSGVNVVRISRALGVERETIEAKLGDEVAA